jgi:hypothetical protein
MPRPGQAAWWAFMRSGRMAGVGKTALAVHAAHRLGDRFPAGQTFLPLQGRTPEQQPVGAADALASLPLTALLIDLRHSEPAAVADHE